MDVTRFAPEITAIRDRFGDLEAMRNQLKMSRRQICKQLMVDPSAWSRWTANGTDSAPPRVYQSLALLLNDQNNQTTEVAKTISRVKAEIETKQEALSLGWKLILILNTMAIFYLFVRTP